jgi:hypothetical protein
LVVQAPTTSAADKAANFMMVEIFIVGISRERKPVPGFRKIKCAPNTSNVLIAKKSQKNDGSGNSGTLGKMSRQAGVYGPH